MVGGGHGRWRWVLAIAALSVVLVGASCTDSDGSDGGGPSPVGDPVDLSAPGFHQLPDPPIAERGTDTINLVEVWTGEEFIVWGGHLHRDASSPGRLLGDGASLSLSDGRWTPLPPAPFAGGLFAPLGAWDGNEMIVIGTDCEATIPPMTDGSASACPDGPAAAAYDPHARSWRELPPPPIPIPLLGTQAVTQSGEAVGTEGGALFVLNREAEALSWDRATETWRSVAPPTNLVLVDLAICVDQSVPQFVASDRSGYPSVPNVVQTLAVGDEAWSDPEGIDLALANRFSCGEGYLATERSDLLDAEGAGGYLVDLAAGRAAPIDPPAELPAFASPWLVGPWLFASWQQRPTDASVSRIPEASHEVRLVDGGEPVPLDLPDGFRDWAEPVLLPGIGVIAVVREPGAELTLWLWQAPPELIP